MVPHARGVGHVTVSDAPWWRWRLARFGRTLLLFVFLTACVSSPPRRALRPAAPTTRPTSISLCVGSTATRRVLEHSVNALRIAERIRAGAYFGRNRFDVELVPGEKCSRSPVGSCHTSETKVQCDATVLARGVLAIAIMSASWTIEAMRIGALDNHLNVPIDGFTAVATADEMLVLRDQQRGLGGIQLLCSFTPDSVEKLMRLAGRVTTFDRSADDEMRSYSDVLAYRIYEAASNFVFAYLLGHELGHAHSVCVSSEPSAAETARFTDFALGLQQEYMPCQGLVADDELRADECGLRIVRDVYRGVRDYHRYRNEYTSKQQRTLLAVARRISAEVVAVLFGRGIGNEVAPSFSAWAEADADFVDAVRGVPAPIDSAHSAGYLVPGLRAALFAREMQLAEFPVARATCPRTQRQLRTSLTSRVRDCGRLPRASDALSRFLRTLQPSQTSRNSTTCVRRCESEEHRAE